MPSVFAASLTGLEFSVDGAETRIKIEFDGPIRYRAALLPDPYRIVIDMDRADWKTDASKPDAALGAIANWRFGNYKPDTSRLVLDLRQSASIVSSFVQQDPVKGTVAAVFSVRTVTRPVFMADAMRLKSEPSVLLSPEKTAAAPPAKTAAVQTSSSAPAHPPAPEATGASAGKKAAVPVAPPAGPSTRKLAAAVETKGVGAPEEMPLEKALEKPASSQSASSQHEAAQHETAMPPPLSRYKGTIRTIVIDPGHGGVDPGTHGANGTWEKNVVLAIGKAIRNKLEATGRFRAILTRDDDTFIPLRGRIGIARQHKANLFISVHADSIKSPNVRGATVYTLSERASDREAEMLARKENAVDLVAGVSVPASDPEVKSILIDLAQRETMNYSARFAGLLLPELDKRVEVHKQGGSHRFAGFVVLKAPEIPSVLLETGYLSNMQDSNFLASAEGQSRIAEAVTKAVLQYFMHEQTPAQQDAR